MDCFESVAEVLQLPQGLRQRVMAAGIEFRQDMAHVLPPIPAQPFNRLQVCPHGAALFCKCMS